MDSSTSLQHTIAIETLFRDAYRILHEIQLAPERVTSLSGSLFHCRKEIRHLERIHSNQSRIFGRDPSEDTLGLRGALDKFMSSCNALTYIVSYDHLDAEVGHGLCLFPSKRGGKEKQKQIRVLEDDFANHERTLSMTVAHAV
jgi:hypothetical protein